MSETNIITNLALYQLTMANINIQLDDTIARWKDMQRELLDNHRKELWKKFVQGPATISDVRVSDKAVKPELRPTNDVNPCGRVEFAELYPIDNQTLQAMNKVKALYQKHLVERLCIPKHIIGDEPAFKINSTTCNFTCKQQAEDRCHRKGQPGWYSVEINNVNSAAINVNAISKVYVDNREVDDCVVVDDGPVTFAAGDQPVSISYKVDNGKAAYVDHETQPQRGTTGGWYIPSDLKEAFRKAQQSSMFSVMYGNDVLTKTDDTLLGKPVYQSAWAGLPRKNGKSSFQEAYYKTMIFDESKKINSPWFLPAGCGKTMSPVLKGNEMSVFVGGVAKVDDDGNMTDVVLESKSRLAKNEGHLIALITRELPADAELGKLVIFGSWQHTAYRF